MPINIERPQSALLRGVRITEFKGHIINPDPIILQETDFLLEEFLSPTKLKALTGVNDLRSVDHLEMIVDTSETSLGNFGIYLPNLKQLKLNGSHVPRIRDLGTSLIHLRVLWLSRSGIVDLDGIPALNNLEELYLAYNEIADISPCSMLENLKCLDLEGNLIEDGRQVEFLNLCPKLINLTLYGNPICSKPMQETNENDLNYSYRHEIIRLLPNLQILDDELTLNTKPLPPIKSWNANEDRKSNQQQQQHECPFEDDWQLINELRDEGIGPPEDKLAINESLRPGTSSSHGSRTSTSVRPLSAMRPLSSYTLITAVKSRPSSRQTTASSIAPGTAGSSSSSTNQFNRGQPEPISDITNETSHLTVGPTLQGNPLKALLARKKTNKSEKEADNDEVPSPRQSTQPANYKSTIKSLEAKTSDEIDDAYKNKDLHEELMRWKKEHMKKLEERKEYFEPQVLKIEDEPVVSDSEQVEENYVEEYVEYKVTGKKFPSVISSSSNILNKIKNSQVPMAVKSTFKQSFDYEASADATGNIASDAPSQSSMNETSLKKERRRSKSRDKSRRRSSSRSSAFDDASSTASSRLATGDTGYASSSLSFSSETNMGASVTSLRDRIRDSQYQPKIVSSATSLTQPSIVKQISQPSLNSLRQLKSNLMPFSGLNKLPRN